MRIQRHSAPPVRLLQCPSASPAGYVHSRVKAFQVDQHEASETVYVHSTRTPPYPSIRTSGPPC